VAKTEAYLYAKFHLDPSNRLATVHERHRQTDRQRTDSIGRTVLQTVGVAQKIDCTNVILSFKEMFDASAVLSQNALETTTLFTDA